MSSATAPTLAFAIEAGNVPRGGASRAGTTTLYRPLEEAHGLTESASTESSRGSLGEPVYDPRYAFRGEAARKLYEEHGQLAEMEALGSISVQDARRRRYVSWQLDQLESASLAPAFAELEKVVELQRRAASALERFQESVEEAKRRKR